jgi:maleylacetoacetate isomerase
MLKLYGYWRSSAAYRVRIALNLKGLAYQLVDEENGGVRIAQSLAILEYLEEIFPVPTLLPADPAERALVRALALHIACDVHPLNNLRVLQYLSTELGASDEAKNAWYRHWVALGLTAVEEGLAPFDGRLSLGERPGYLEACLIPQLYNARRFNCDLAAYPRILALAARCEPLQALQQAAPEVQPDAQ